MPERRQAQRREPIEVEIRGEVVEARPLPWFRRNDLGNEVIHQYAELLNSTLRTYTNPDTGAPEVEMFLNDKLKDPIAILRLAYPHVEEFQGADIDLEYSEIYELLFAALEVNDLKHLREIVDPNFQTPTPPGGSEPSGMEKRTRDILNQQSILSSSSVDSPAEMSSSSPTEKSSTSSENETESSGTNDGGSTPSEEKATS